jgi:hypothetical protein
MRAGGGDDANFATATRGDFDGELIGFALLYLLNAFVYLVGG